MRYEVITTMSQKNWDQYGKDFLDSYVKFWEVPIHVYWEGNDHPKGYSKQVCWHNLEKDVDRAAFLETYADKHSQDYRFNATKFCHKVFAFTDSKRRAKGVDYWIWLDADVESLAEVSNETLDSFCVEGFSGTYLGRKDWHHSELGFLAVHKSAWGLLERLREIYTSGELFSFKEWHDSYIFDQIKDEFGWWYNLSQDIPGMHVWDDCPLGSYMAHKKGPLRKKGIKPSQNGYASSKEAGVGTVGGDELLIKTKNCVPDENIRANIHYSSTFEIPELPQCDLSLDAVCIMVSAGPSLESQLPHIKELAAKPNHYVVAVKHALLDLKEAGIPVWACVLLDPRPHVADFVPEGKDDTMYFVASMCHPTVFDKLSQKVYYKYHAHVGAGENEVLANRLGPETFMISGGCSTAMRGLGVMRLLGFRRFRLFAYDFCFYEEKDDSELDKYGNQKYFEIDIAGRKFWVDAEKVAQAQDFQTVMDAFEDMEIEVYGPGVAPHMFNQDRKILPKFTDVLDGRHLHPPGTS